MVDAWINCQNCGNRYGSWTSACPKCGSGNSNYARRSNGTKRLKKIVLYSLAGFGAVIGILLIIGFAVLANDGSASSNNSLTDTGAPQTIQQRDN